MTQPPNEPTGSPGQPGTGSGGHAPPPVYGGAGQGGQGYGAPPPTYGRGGPDDGPPSGQGAPSNGLGIAALVVGVLALLTAIPFFPLGAVLGLVGIGLGIAGRRRASRGRATNGGMALTGLILSVLGLLLAVAIGFAVGYVLSEAEECTDSSLSQAEQQQCLEDQLGG